MRKQEGGGALRTGNPGNRGGPGRPPSRLRALCRRLAGPRLQVLGQISSKKSKSKDSDKIKAIDVLLKYGMDRSISVADLRGALDEQRQIILHTCEPAVAERLLAALKSLWGPL